MSALYQLNALESISALRPLNGSFPHVFTLDAQRGHDNDFQWSFITGIFNSCCGAAVWMRVYMFWVWPELGSNELVCENASVAKQGSEQEWWHDNKQPSMSHNCLCWDLMISLCSGARGNMEHDASATHKPRESMTSRPQWHSPSCSSCFLPWPLPAWLQSYLWQPGPKFGFNTTVIY